MKYVNYIWMWLIYGNGNLFILFLQLHLKMEIYLSYASLTMQ